jgi:hypothetical protein
MMEVSHLTAGTPEVCDEVDAGFTNAAQSPQLCSKLVVTHLAEVQAVYVCISSDVLLLVKREGGLLSE